MNQESIGKTAGIIWRHLAESGDGLTISAIKKVSGVKGDEAVAAIGWLAREGKLEFRSERRKLVIALVGARVLC